MVNTEYYTEYFFCSNAKLVETICSALEAISHPEGLTYIRGQVDTSIINSLRPVHLDAYTDYIQVDYVFCNEYRRVFKWSDYIGNMSSEVKFTTLSIHDDRSDNPGVWVDGKQIDLKPLASVETVQGLDDLDMFLGKGDST